MSRYTAHPSHTMGIVEDEPCCTACYAATWMAIVEQECARGHRSAAYDRGEHLTLAEVQQAAAAHDAGEKWDDIGEVMGRSGRSLCQAVSRLRRGQGRLAREAVRLSGCATVIEGAL